MKIWTRAQIDELLNESDRAVERAIVQLFKAQTRDELASSRSKHQNERGFAACDAVAGTRMARWLLGMNDRNVVRYPAKPLNHPRCHRILGRYAPQGGTVMDRARSIALKHSAQLVDIANHRERTRYLTSIEQTLKTLTYLEN